MFTPAHAITASAVLLALAICAPVAAAQTDVPPMPVETDPHYLDSGSPTPDGAPVTLGTDSATVAPGSTTATTVVPPATPATPGSTPGTAATTAPARASVRITCRRGRGSRRVRCVARSGRTVVTTCTYRARRVTSRHRSSCRRRAQRSLGTGTRAASISWQGFPRQTAPAVGQIYFQGRRHCTATVVNPTLVLTAAHCIWAGGRYHDINQIRFVPGQTWGDPSIPSSVLQPNGVWAASDMWVTSAYTRGDVSGDFALLEIPPLNDGRRLGDIVGMYSVTPNVRWDIGTRAYLMGYPVLGYWGTSEGLHGRGQYACDSSWSGHYQRDGAGWSIATDCAMNQGASGGPWFVLVGNRWTIAGVNSRCTAYAGSPADVCLPYAREMLTSYVDNGFLAFWNAVQPQLAYR